MPDKSKHVPYSLQVENLLKSTNDFMSLDMLMAALFATEVNYGRLTASLHHLRKSGVVDVVVNHDGKGWWFYCGPAHDTREYVKELIADETAPRKPRKARVVKVKKEPS